MTKPLKLIVGLGNPGSKYSGTRHNVGEHFLQEFANQQHTPLALDKKFQSLYAKQLVDGNPLYLLAPQTFMNLSGQAVRAICDYFEISSDEMLVVHDEIDLDPGIIKLKKSGGHGGHNGLRNIIQQLGTPDFYRLRVGVGHPGDRSMVVNYVLSQPSKSENQLIQEAIDHALAVMPFALHGDWEKAMQQLHSQ